jgi:hypothetical protein
VNRPLVLACGALVRELRAVLAEDGLGDAVDVEFLPAPLHNRPERIVPAIRERLAAEPVDRPVFLGYADCGTGGELDRFLAGEERQIVRLPGDHCYGFLAGLDRFTELHAEELGSFFLTDFLARHFDAIVWQGLGLDRHPELHDLYFAAYRRVVLLTQTGDAAVLEAATAAADRLRLELVVEHTGLGPFARSVRVALDGAVA